VRRKGESFPSGEKISSGGGELICSRDQHPLIVEPDGCRLPVTCYLPATGTTAVAPIKSRPQKKAFLFSWIWPQIEFIVLQARFITSGIELIVRKAKFIASRMASEYPWLAW